MTVLSQDYVLSNGVRIPKLGFGVWQVPDDVAPGAVVTALAAGYRHIDTARVYRNEAGVGQGLKASGVARDQVFVTTKVPSALKDAAEFPEFLAESLRRLGTDYLDLLLIHGPHPWPALPEHAGKTFFEENAAVWQAMEVAYEQGALRAIGVSNFEIPDMENILTTCSVAPMVNQIEFRIGYTEDELTAFCQERGILIEAYSPLGIGRLIDNPDIVAVATGLGVSVPQLCIRYCLQKGTLPLPKSVHPEYIQANTRVDFEVAEADMAVLDALVIDLE